MLRMDALMVLSLEPAGRAETQRSPGSSFWLSDYALAHPTTKSEDRPDQDQWLHGARHAGIRPARARLRWGGDCAGAVSDMRHKGPTG